MWFNIEFGQITRPKYGWGSSRPDRFVFLSVHRSLRLRQRRSKSISTASAESLSLAKTPAIDRFLRLYSFMPAPPGKKHLNVKIFVSLAWSTLQYFIKLALQLYWTSVIYSRIVNRAGNPYGCPIKYLDVLGSNVSPTEDGVSLEREMPVGSKISVTAKQVDSPFVNYLALQVIHSALIKVVIWWVE